MTENYILQSATTVSGEVRDVVIENGLIAAKISTGVKHEEVDCTGLVVLPGF